MRLGTVLFALALAGAVPASAQQANANVDQRRGFFGLTLSCGECYVERAPGRVGYAARPAILNVTRGGPADRAGLQRGDTLLSVDGLDLLTPEGFERFAWVAPGQSLRLTVRRGGQQRDVSLVLGESQGGPRSARDYYSSALRSARVRGVEAYRAAFQSPMGWLGMGLECEGCSVAYATRPVARFRSPPVVLTVDVDGPAHRAGLRRGDTLLAIDGMELTSTEGGRAFAALDPGQRVALTVRRDGRERQVRLTAVARPDASADEIAAYQGYRRMRDSVSATYREAVTGALARAQVEMRDLERMMRDTEINRTVLDSTRKALTVIDSALRAARNAERMAYGRALGGRYIVTPDVAVVVAPTPPTPPTPMAAMVAPAPPAGYAYGWPAAPLRYSGRLGELVNVEARAPGAVNVSEIGDSVIVVTAGDVVVRITQRPAAMPAVAPAQAPAPAPASTPAPAPRPSRPRP